MQTLVNMYKPITAAPFRNSDSYTEIAPCDALKPYIRCFWGTMQPIEEKPASSLVIPDTCVDIIFDISYTENRYNACVCTVDEHSYRTDGKRAAGKNATFAIRFYAWTAMLFSERGFSGCKNAAFPVDEFFGRLRAELQPLLFDEPSLTGKIAVAERVLLETLHTQRVNSNLLNAIHYMLTTNGRARLSDLYCHTAVSGRQLERIFDSCMGVSPKTFSSLLRYQLLWQELMLSGNISVLDAVEKYGYSDQSHLLRDFKSRHLMTPKQAVEYAQKNRL